MPGVPPALAALVHRCLAKDPAQRPATADEVVAALDTALTGSGPVAVAMPAPRWRLPAIVGVAGLGLALAWWMLGRRDAPAGGVPPNSLAVLPLTLSGGDSADAYFADGITEELSRRRPSRGCRASGWPRPPPPSRCAGAAPMCARWPASLASPTCWPARCAAAGTGSAWRCSSPARRTAWCAGPRAQREVTDVFQVQEEVGRAIASALEVAFEPAARPWPPEPPATWRPTICSSRAVSTGAERGEASLRLAAGYFEQAIARDSSFARAWAGLADALGLLPVYGPTPVDSVLPIVERAAGRALALDSTLADAHAARGQLQDARALERCGDRAPPRHRRRLDLCLRPPVARRAVRQRGPSADAVAAMQAAARIDPMSPIITGELGYLLALAGQHDSPRPSDGAPSRSPRACGPGTPSSARPISGRASRRRRSSPSRRPCAWRRRTFGGVHVAAVAGASNVPGRSSSCGSSRLRGGRGRRRPPRWPSGW